MSVENNIPKHWQIKKFEDFLDYIQPTPFIVESTDYSDNHKIPVLTAGKSFILGKTNEKNGIFNSLPVIIFDDFTTANKFVNFPFKVKSSAMKILKPKNELVNIKFVFYYMQTVRITYDTHKRYWISIFSQLPVPSPPLHEQQAIVSKIEELLSDLENGKQQLQTAQQQLKVYRQSLLKWAFEGKLTNKNLKEGELPKGWQVESLSKVAKIVSGFAFKSSDFVPDGIPVVKISNIGYSEFVWKDQQYLPKEFLKSNPDFVLRSGDLLIALTRPITNNTTKVCQYPSNTGDALLNQRVACIKELKANKDFIFLFFQTNVFKEYIRSKFSETLQPNLSPKDLALTPIPVCSFEEQQLIVSELESKLTVCDKIEETISQSLQQAETLRQSILKKAFEGKLVQTEVFTDKKRNYYEQ